MNRWQTLVHAGYDELSLTTLLGLNHLDDLDDPQVAAGVAKGAPPLARLLLLGDHAAASELPPDLLELLQQAELYRGGKAIGRVVPELEGCFIDPTRLERALLRLTPRRHSRSTLVWGVSCGHAMTAASHSDAVTYGPDAVPAWASLEAGSRPYDLIITQQDGIAVHARDLAVGGILAAVCGSTAADEWPGKLEGSWGVLYIECDQGPSKLLRARHPELFLADRSAGVLLLQHLPDGATSWSAQRTIPFPNMSLASYVEGWLDAWAAYGPDYQVDLKRPLPRLDWHRQLWVEARTGLGRLDFGDPAWGPPLDLDPHQTWLARQLNGRTRPPTLIHKMASQAGLSDRDALELLSSELRFLGQNQMLR